MSEQTKLLEQIQGNVKAVGDELKAAEERREKGTAEITQRVEGVASDTAEKFKKLDADFEGVMKRFDALDKEKATAAAVEEFPYKRKEELNANMEAFNASVRADRHGTGGAPSGGFTDIKAYDLYERHFIDACSPLRMKRLEERFGTASDEFKMAVAIRRSLTAAIDDATQTGGGALLPEAFSALIEHTGRLQSRILPKVKTVTVSNNEYERILSTTTAVQRGRGARVANDPLRGSRGGTGDSTPTYYEQKTVVTDAWTRPYIHEDQFEDAVASAANYLLIPVAMDFAAEEEEQCVAGTATVSAGAQEQPTSGAWTGIFGGTGTAAQTANGLAANFDPYADANRFKPVVRVISSAAYPTSGAGQAFPSGDTSASGNLYEVLVDLQFSVTQAYRKPTSCYVGGTRVLTAIRNLKDADGRPVFDMDRSEGDQYRPRVLGKEYVEAEHAPDPQTTAAAAHANATSPIAFGDFMMGYTRVVRRGVRVRQLNHEPPYISYYISKRDRGFPFDGKAYSLFRQV